MIMKRLFSVFMIMTTLLLLWCVSSCQFPMNRGEKSEESVNPKKTELVGWDYLSKIKVHVPGGGGFAGHSCEATLYVKSVGETIYYKILVYDTEDPYHGLEKPKEEEFLVEKNPKYQSVDVLANTRGYKYKAGRYYFNMDY